MEAGKGSQKISRRINCCMLFRFLTSFINIIHNSINFILGYFLGPCFGPIFMGHVLVQLEYGVNRKRKSLTRVTIGLPWT